MTLRARNDIHLARRVWHVCGVLTISALYYAIPDPQVAALLAIAASTILIGFDMARLFVPTLNRLFTWMFRPVLRESEKRSLSGLSALMAGVTIIILVYPRNVVFLTLLFQAFADPLASYFGIRYGKDKLIGNKSVQGTLAAFVVCFALGFAYFSALDLMTERLFIVCLLGALIGAISELVPVGKMDDNFVFPILAGTLLTGLFYIFGGLQ